MKKLGGWVGLAALSMVAVACTANVESASDSVEGSNESGSRLHDELLPVNPVNGGGGGVGTGSSGGSGSSGSSGGTTTYKPSSGAGSTCNGVPFPNDTCGNGQPPVCTTLGWTCLDSGACNACFVGTGSSGSSGSGGITIFQPVHFD